MVTINALLATAAWIDGLNVITLDQTGTAQKGGAVVSHVLLSKTPLAAPTRTNVGNADLILGFDLIGAANPENLKVASADRTVAVVNTDLVPTIDSIRSRTVLAGPERMLDEVNRVTKRRLQRLRGCESNGGDAVRYASGSERFPAGSGLAGRIWFPFRSPHWSNRLS